MHFLILLWATEEEALCSTGIDPIHPHGKNRRNGLPDPTAMKFGGGETTPPNWRQHSFSELGWGPMPQATLSFRKPGTQKTWLACCHAPNLFPL